MTQNNRHIRNSSFTPSPAHTALRRLTKVIGIILGMIIGDCSDIPIFAHIGEQKNR